MCGRPIARVRPGQYALGGCYIRICTYANAYIRRLLRTSSEGKPELGLPKLRSRVRASSAALGAQGQWPVGLTGGWVPTLLCAECDRDRRSEALSPVVL
jgi:hypothetical protein